VNNRDKITKIAQLHDKIEYLQRKRSELASFMDWALQQDRELYIDMYDLVEKVHEPEGGMFFMMEPTSRLEPGKTMELEVDEVDIVYFCEAFMRIIDFKLRTLKGQVDAEFVGKA